MATKRTRKTAAKKPQTTAQRLGSVVKSIRQIMRKDKGLNGELDRLPQLTWILLLKLLDDSEKIREDETILKEETYKPVLKPPYRWRDWAADEEGMGGDQLKNFINNEEVTLPDGTRCPGLLAYLRSLQSDTGRERADVIAKVFQDITNRMLSGPLLRDVVNKINEIHFDNSEEVNILSAFYEAMLKEMRDAAGDSGEFYTPRPVVRFMVRVLDPQIGDVIMDPACGTAGFLVETFLYLRQHCHPQNWSIIQSSIMGGEAKSLPYLLALMNLLIHGVEYPHVEFGNSLAKPLTEIGAKDQVDMILTNPPFGGEEEDKIKKNFPPNLRTSETALLFLQLIMRRLKKKPTPGRAGVVVPNGVLFGDGTCALLKEKLLKEFNLHTIVRLPEGVFEPYTKIPTNLLFFEAGKPTETIWYYAHPLPEGRKNYTKTKPVGDEEFQDCIDWWGDRPETERAWKYDFKIAYDEAIAKAQPHWDTARETDTRANEAAQTAKTLREAISQVETDLASLEAGNNQIKPLKAKLAELKKALKTQEKTEKELRNQARAQKACGDELYYPIFNLDQKNPNIKDTFEHVPPEDLLASILEKDRRVAELMAEIKDLLHKKPL
ncbi:MAG: N-6 DNA methylase [Leptolyngbyaceae cyanobacterium]